MTITHTQSLWIAGAGAGFLLVAGILVQRVRSFRETATRAPGVVIAHVAAGRGAAAQYEFQTPDGRRWQQTSRVSSSPPMFRVGQAVTILYEADDPEHSSIDSWIQLWFAPALLAGFGVAGLVAGWIFGR